MKRHVRKTALYADPGVSIYQALDAVERHGIRHRHLESRDNPDLCDLIVLTNPNRGLHWHKGTKKQQRRRIVVTIRAEYKEKEQRNAKAKGTPDQLPPSTQGAAAGSSVLRITGDAPGAGD